MDWSIKQLEPKLLEIAKNTSQIAECMSCAYILGKAIYCKESEDFNLIVLRYSINYLL